MECSTDPGEGFEPLTNAWQLDFGETQAVVDPNSPERRKFYRVKVSK